MGGFLDDVLGMSAESTQQEAQAGETAKETTEETKEKTVTEAPVESTETEKTVTEEPNKEGETETETETEEHEETEEGKEKTATDAPAEEVKPNEELSAVVKEFVPDAQVTDDKSAIVALKTKLTENKQLIENFEKWDKELTGMFEENPELVEFLKAIKNEGMSPAVAAAVYISETLTPEEGTEENEKYKEALKGQKKKAEDKKAKQEEYRTNLQASQKTIKEYVNETKIPEKEMEDILTEADSEVAKLNSGIISKRFLELMVKGKTFDAEIKRLKDEQKKEIDAAYLRGKNEKIKLVKEKKSETDNLPDISGKGKGKDDISRRPSMLDIALDRKR
jgi:hypothetical protein